MWPEILNGWSTVIFSIVSTMIGGATAWYFGFRNKYLDLKKKELELIALRKELEITGKSNELSRDASNQSSIELLIQHLEDVRKRLIIEIAKGVQNAQVIGERDRLINALKTHCPDCYQTFIDTYGESYGLNNLTKDERTTPGIK